MSHLETICKHTQVALKVLSRCFGSLHCIGRDKSRHSVCIYAQQKPGETKIAKWYPYPICCFVGEVTVSFIVLDTEKNVDIFLLLQALHVTHRNSNLLLEHPAVSMTIKRPFLGLHIEYILLVRETLKKNWSFLGIFPK